jgi:hypothetical protein
MTEHGKYRESQVYHAVGGALIDPVKFYIEAQAFFQRVAADSKNTPPEVTLTNVAIKGQRASGEIVLPDGKKSPIFFVKTADGWRFTGEKLDEG